jgi:hypothetical protein
VGHGLRQLTRKSRLRQGPSHRRRGSDDQENGSGQCRGLDQDGIDHADRESPIEQHSRHQGIGIADRDAKSVFVMVVTAAQAELVLFGKNGAAAVMDPGSVVVLSTTMAPDQAEAIGRRLGKRGILMLDAPV